MRILANDGMAPNGVEMLEKEGFTVFTDNIPQSDLIAVINKENIDAIIVRSATQVRKELIDACPSLKLIGRAGVGMDNIDVEYAKGKGLYVVNTPGASSNSVAELVIGHLIGMVRFLYDANRNMPLEGDTRFKDLKKAYSQGTELKGKKLGILGFGRIGQSLAKIAIGMGMEVLVHDIVPIPSEIELEFYNGMKVQFPINAVDKDVVLRESDFISVHVPAMEEAYIAKSDFMKMKKGVCIVNAARGGVIDEVDLIEAIDKDRVKHAALDVFVEEPTPAIQVLMNPSISLSPHIGGQTVEAQERIGEELAEQIIALL